MKVSNLVFLMILVAFFLESCSTKYQKYQADWIVVDARFKGKDIRDIITFFNFTINVRGGTARPCDISFTDEFILRKDVPIKLRTRKGQDYIEIFDHYNLTGKYQIQCLDKNCCTISLKNDKFYLEMIYNSDIPWGVSRDCR